MAIRTIDIPHLLFEELTRFINNEAKIRRISANASLYEALWDPQYSLIPLITRIFESTIEKLNISREEFSEGAKQAINDVTFRHPSLSDSLLKINILCCSRAFEQFIQSEPNITWASCEFFYRLTTNLNLAMGSQESLEFPWWQSRILMSAKNDPTNEALTVFAPAQFSQNSILDPRIQIRTMFDQVDMTRKGGICRGAVELFISRFLKTKPAFTNTVVHLITLAEEFYDGGPPESQVIQQLGLRSVEGTDSSSHILSLSNVHKDSNKNEMIQQTKNLPSGIYNCSLNGNHVGHALALIKTGEEAYYIFDPNFGLFSLRGAEEVLKFIQEIYKDMTEYSFSLCEGKVPFQAPYDIHEIIFSPNRHENNTSINADIRIIRNTFDTINDLSIRRNPSTTWSLRSFFYNLYSYSIILPLIFGCFSFIFKKISNVFLPIFHRISRILFIKNN